jgi:hypothetical protein
MQNEQLILLLTELSFGAVATFLAILLWSKTRDSAWMFIVIGTIIGYGRIVYQTLQVFGVIGDEWITIAGVSLADILFINLPLIFFIIAFIIMIIRKSMR